MKIKNIAIVTGGSDGLGKQFAKLLVSKKQIDEVWIIARNKQKLNLVANELGPKIKTYSIDLSNVKKIKNFEIKIAKSNVNIGVLVNNAGFAKFGSYNDLSIDGTIDMVNLNINGLIAMGLICIPYMKKGSYIINISSVASFTPLPYQNVYSATKAFVRSYSRALNVELKHKKIHVMTVCPGWMKTNLYYRAKTGAIKEPTNFSGIVTPDVVAKKALDDAVKRKKLSVYGLQPKILHAFSKILPQEFLIKVWLLQQGL